MNVHIVSDVLVAALQRAAKSISRKTTLPVLGAVLVETVGGHVRLRSTDLEVYLDQTVGAWIRQPGALAIPVAELLAFVKSQPKGAVIEIEVADDKAIVSGPHGQTTIASFAADEFPTPGYLAGESTAKAEVRAPDLLRALTAVSYIGEAADEARPILCSTLFRFLGNELRLVGADNYRLIVEQIPADYDGTLPGDTQVVVPARTTKLLRALLGTKPRGFVQYEYVNQTYGRFSLPNSDVLTTRLIDGHYPNYEQVIPVGRETRARIPVDALIQIGATKAPFVRIGLEPNLLVAVTSIDDQKTSLRIPIQYDGPDQQIAFNPQYLRDFGKNAPSKELDLLVDGALVPALLESPDTSEWRGVLMPVRVTPGTALPAKAAA